MLTSAVIEYLRLSEACEGHPNPGFEKSREVASSGRTDSSLNLIQVQIIKAGQVVGKTGRQQSRHSGRATDRCQDGGG